MKSFQVEKKTLRYLEKSTGMPQYLKLFHSRTLFSNCSYPVGTQRCLPSQRASMCLRMPYKEKKNHFWFPPKKLEVTFLVQKAILEPSDASGRHVKPLRASEKSSGGRDVSLTSKEGNAGRHGGPLNQFVVNWNHECGIRRYGASCNSYISYVTLNKNGLESFKFLCLAVLDHKAEV